MYNLSMEYINQRDTDAQYPPSVVPINAEEIAPLSASPGTTNVAATSSASLRTTDDVGNFVYGPGSGPRDACKITKYGRNLVRSEVTV